MRKNECERLVAEYLGWLKEGLRVKELEACCRISTPFLDRHNDEIEIYAEKRNGGIVLTDDGYTIADLEATGMSFETEKRKAHLQPAGSTTSEHGNACRPRSLPCDWPRGSFRNRRRHVNVPDFPGRSRPFPAPLKII